MTEDKKTPPPETREKSKPPERNAAYSAPPKQHWDKTELERIAIKIRDWASI